MAKNGAPKLARDRNGYAIQAASALTTQAVTFSADRVWNADQDELVRITAAADAYVAIESAAIGAPPAEGLLILAGQAVTLKITKGWHIRASATINVCPWI